MAKLIEILRTIGVGAVMLLTLCLFLLCVATVAFIVGWWVVVASLIAFLSYVVGVAFEEYKEIKIRQKRNEDNATQYRK